VYQPSHRAQLCIGSHGSGIAASMPVPLPPGPHASGHRRPSTSPAPARNARQHQCTETAAKTTSSVPTHEQSQARTATHSAHLLFPGGGTFFWWQLGATTILNEQVDLSRVLLSGCSAGALAAVFTRCRINPAVAHAAAHKLCIDNGVYDKPYGLLGKWGSLVRAWLDELLPSDAAAVCDGNISIVYTKLFAPWPRAERISRFRTRADLIAALLASTHIPLLMDGRLTTRCPDGFASIDGSFLQFFGLVSNVNLLCEHASQIEHAVLLDFHQDVEFRHACIENNWSSVKPDGTDAFIAYGAKYARRCLAQGSDGLFATLTVVPATSNGDFITTASESAKLVTRSSETASFQGGHPGYSWSTFLRGLCEKRTVSGVQTHMLVSQRHVTQWHALGLLGAVLAVLMLMFIQGASGRVA